MDKPTSESSVLDPQLSFTFSEKDLGERAGRGSYQYNMAVDLYFLHFW